MKATLRGINLLPEGVFSKNSGFKDKGGNIFSSELLPLKVYLFSLKVILIKTKHSPYAHICLCLYRI